MKFSRQPTGSLFCLPPGNSSRCLFDHQRVSMATPVPGSVSPTQLLRTCTLSWSQTGFTGLVRQRDSASTVTSLWARLQVVYAFPHLRAVRVACSLLSSPDSPSAPSACLAKGKSVEGKSREWTGSWGWITRAWPA